MQTFKVLFFISLGQIIRSKKTIFMTALAFLPVLMALYYRLSGRVGNITPEQAVSFIMMLYSVSIATLVALFYGVSLIADEVDNKTIIYLFTRPIRKYSIPVAKFAVYILTTFLILIPPAIITFFIISIGTLDMTDFVNSLAVFSRQVAVVILALMVYGAIFLFLGAWQKHSILIGLIFAFGWEKMILIVPGVLRRFSVIHYLLSLFPRGVLQSGFNILPPGANVKSPEVTSIIVLLSIFIVFLGLSLFTISHKEFSFE